MQEIHEKYPNLRYVPAGRYLSRQPVPQQGARDASSSSGLLSALERAVKRVARGFRRDRDSEIGEIEPVSEPRQLEGPPQQASSSRHNLDKRRRFFLLYLNNKTWLDEAGSELADQAPRSPHVNRTSATPANRSSPPHPAAARRASLCTPSRCAPRAPRASA